MSNLQSAIEKAADAFAREIIDAVKAASLQELLGVREIAVEAPARRRGRPPKAATAKKPVKKVAKKAAKKAIKAPAKKKRHINYPKCSVPGCKKNRYARGNGMCGDHFKASKKG